jgi:hypothetical protein
MTIHAQPSGTDSPPAPARAAEHQTDDLAPVEGPIVASISLLDHRARLRLIPAGTAPAGRYLEVDDQAGGSRQLIPLDRPIIHVGRGLIADVRIEDPHTSRRHAIIALRGGGARVLDDRSANGTFVNGRQVTVAQLSDGDVLRFGRAVFRYVEVVRAPARRRPLRRFLVAPAQSGRSSGVRTPV